MMSAHRRGEVVHGKADVAREVNSKCGQGGRGPRGSKNPAWLFLDVLSLSNQQRKLLRRGLPTGGCPLEPQVTGDFRSAK